MPSKELYIGNINPDTRSQEIKEIFEQYGNVNRCEVKFGGSAYSVAFGFVGFESRDDAERAQRKEHGRTLRGRRLIVEFTKTTPGQNGQRGGRYTGGDERMINRNGNERDRSRSYNGDDYRGGYKRRRSPSYTRKSSRDRSKSRDRNRKRDRSRSPRNHKSSSKRHRSSSNDHKCRNSHSHKNGNSNKN